MISHCPVCQKELVYDRGSFDRNPSLSCNEKVNFLVHFYFAFNEFVNWFYLCVLTPENKLAHLLVTFDKDRSIKSSKFELLDDMKFGYSQNKDKQMQVKFSNLEEFIEFAFSVSNGTNPNILFI